MRSDASPAAHHCKETLSPFRALCGGVVLLFLLFFLPGASSAAVGPSPVPGLSPEEALLQGERMYREGILPSGEPLQAVVEGDIPVEGTQFACASCHLRSGLGSVEGTILTPPVNGLSLYQPLPRGQKIIGAPRERLPLRYRSDDVRPAYTDGALALAIQAGIDSKGRILDPVMPRYMLSGTHMDIMVFYLKSLSSEVAPGVTDKAIRFATVLAEGMPQQDREAMLSPLEAFFRDRTSQVRHQEVRSRTGGPFLEEMYSAYRTLLLSRWELKGPPEEWHRQLEEYYRREPVFALVAGIAPSWEPIHAFCERNRIPCILPLTDLPVLSEADWYTLYFSKGLYQEGAAAARYLSGDGGLSPDAPVVQIFRDSREGRTLSKAFGETREKLGKRRPESRMLGPDEVVDALFWKSLARQYEGAVFLAWLSPEELAEIEALADTPGRPAAVFVAAGLLGRHMDSLPEGIRERTYITYPYRLPEEDGRTRLVVEKWLKFKNISVTDFSIQSRMYFLGGMISEALMMMQGNFYRDYFLDVIDMMRDQTYSIALYPRLSFGMGQRYAAKGCYIVQLTGGPRPRLVKRSEWVVH